MLQKELVFDHTKQTYRTIGHGPAVVLLHGFGEDGQVWRYQFDAFPGYQLIIPDLPGSGGSEPLQDMSMEHMAAVVLAILDKEIGHQKKAVLIGHSMGGYIALAFAEKYSERLSAFGLFHSTAFADSEEKKDTRKKGISFMRQHGAAAFLKTTIPNLFSKEIVLQQPGSVDEQIATTHNFTAEALVMYYEAMMQRPDRTTVLKTTTLPVLHVMGRHDNAIPVTDGFKQCFLSDISYIELLEQTGHMGMIEEKDQSIHILKNFLQFTHLT